MLNMARGISSIVTTAVVAGAIGFGAGVYLVPNEKADQFRTMADEKANQFRAMVHGGLGAIYRVVYSDKADVEPSQTKPPGEISRTEAQPNVPAGSQRGVDAQCDPGDPKCRGGLPVDAAAPQATPDREVAAPSSSPPEHDEEPSHALNTDPSGTVPPGISDRDVAAPSNSPPKQDDQPSRALNTDPSGTVPPGISDRDVAAPSSSPPKQDDQPSRALNTDPSGSVPPGISDPDVAAPSSSPPKPDNQPSHALNADPSGTVPPNSSPNIESDAPTPVAPETAKKKRPAKKVKPKSSPSE
jgi:hypothetical protein